MTIIPISKDPPEAETEKSDQKEGFLPAVEMTMALFGQPQKLLREAVRFHTERGKEIVHMNALQPTTGSAVDKKLR